MEQSRGKGVLSNQQHGLCLVGKRGGGAGPSTPSPTWRLEMFPSHDGNIDSAKQFLTSPLNNSVVSARKLCATLWEIQPQHSPSPARMRKSASNPCRKVKTDRGFDFDHPDVEPRQFQNANGAYLQQCQSRQNEHTDLSSASYTSSVEVAPYRHPFSPVSSLKGPIGASYGDRDKTSTELLKILNRIWSLEEQHTTNSSLTKSLKQELLRSRAKVTELVQDKQKERRLRECSEMKSGFSTMLRELERERKARVLLESLCDEFARGVRDYDSELRLAKHKLREDTLCGQSLDHSVLHISEAWLDERMQMKQTRGVGGGMEKDMIVDHLCPEIETFLRARQSVEKAKEKESSKGRKYLRRHSLESYVLNEATSAPGLADEHSSGSDFHGQERRGSSKQDMANSSSVEAKVVHGNGGFRSLSLKGDRLHYRSNGSEVSSPLQQQRFKPDDSRASELSLKFPQGVKENTLMAKLLEARLESRRYLQSRASTSRLSV